MAIYTSDGTNVSDCNADIVLPDPEILNQMRRDYEELKRMADAAEHRMIIAMRECDHSKKLAELSEQQAKDAKKQAMWANVKSWAAGILSVISITGMLLTDAKPIMESIRKVLSLLGWAG